MYEQSQSRRVAPYFAHDAVQWAGVIRMQRSTLPASLIPKVLLDGEDISAEIRTLDVAQAASIVSTVSDVRRRMVELQREIGENAPNGCVLEGRDIGSVVFPNADIKFFLTAKPEARARRRFEEDPSKSSLRHCKTLAEIPARRARRFPADSPLKIAEDAVVIDTSDLDLTEVFELMVTKVRERKSASA